MNYFTIAFFFTVQAASGGTHQVPDGVAYVAASSVAVCDAHAAKLKAVRLEGRAIPQGWRLDHLCIPLKDTPNT